MHPADATLARHCCRATVRDRTRRCTSGYLDLLPGEHSTTYEFTNRLLRREARSEVKMRPAPGPTVGQFGGSEHPLCQPRMTLECASETLDLDQIQSAATGSVFAPLPIAVGEYDHSTVTVFARLRGWSTFSPLCLAT